MNYIDDFLIPVTVTISVCLFMAWILTRPKIYKKRENKK